MNHQYLRWEEGWTRWRYIAAYHGKRWLWEGKATGDNPTLLDQILAVPAFNPV